MSLLFNKGKWEEAEVDGEGGPMSDVSSLSSSSSFSFAVTDASKVSFINFAVDPFPLSHLFPMMFLLSLLFCITASFK